MNHKTSFMDAAARNATALTMTRPPFACFGDERHAQYCRVVPAPFASNQRYQDYAALLPPSQQWFAYTTVSPPISSLLAAVDAERASAERLLAHPSQWGDHYAELWNQVDAAVRRLHGWSHDFHMLFCRRAKYASQLALDMVSGGNYTGWGFMTFAEGVFVLAMMRGLVGKSVEVVYFFGDLKTQIADGLTRLVKKSGTKNILFQVPILTELGRLIESSVVDEVKEVLEKSVSEGVIDHYVIIMDGPQAANRHVAVFSDDEYPVDFWISTVGKAGLSPWNTSVLAYKPDQIAAKGLPHDAPWWLPSIVELVAMRVALSVWAANDEVRLKHWTALMGELSHALEERLGDRIHVGNREGISHPGIALIRVTGQDGKTLTSRLRDRLVFEFHIPLGTVGVRKDEHGVAEHFVRIGLPPHTLMIPQPDIGVLIDAIKTALQ